MQKLNGESLNIVNQNMRYDEWNEVKKTIQIDNVCVGVINKDDFEQVKRKFKKLID
jgi:hypothetical protein